MSLLRDIQQSAIESNVDIATLLRKCKVLGARLGNAEFKNWVNKELNGYQLINELPEYRILNVQSKGNFSGPLGSGLNNANIPLLCLPEKLRDQLEKAYCMQPISAYESLIKNSKGNNLHELWDPNLVAAYGEDIYRNMNCLSAWKVIPNSAVVALLDTVRNRILNFVLDIEAENPSAGEALINEPLIAQEKVTQVFNTNIYGNVENLADGCSNFQQTLNINVSEGDFKSLKRQLENWGLQQSEITLLNDAMKADNKNDSKEELGPRAKEWLSNVNEKIAKGTISIAKGVTTKLITQAILMFCGIQ